MHIHMHTPPLLLDFTVPVCGAAGHSVCVYGGVCMRMCMCMCVYVCMRMCVCMYIHTYAYVCVCMYIHTYILRYAYVCVYVYAYLHTPELQLDFTVVVKSSSKGQILRTLFVAQRYSLKSRLCVCVCVCLCV